MVSLLLSTVPREFNLWLSLSGKTDTTLSGDFQIHNAQTGETRVVCEDVCIPYENLTCLNQVDGEILSTDGDVNISELPEDVCETFFEGVTLSFQIGYSQTTDRGSWCEAITH